MTSDGFKLVDGPKTHPLVKWGGHAYAFYIWVKYRGRDRLQLDLQLPMELVPITTNVVGSNSGNGEV